MGLHHSPSTVYNNLLFCYDAGNSRSYPGTGTSFTDLSGNSNNGTLVGSPTFTSGSTGVNSHFTLNGSNQQITTTIPITTTPALSNFTYEVWTRITSFPSAVAPNGNGITYTAGVLLGATSYAGAALYWIGNAAGNACTIYGYIRGQDAYRSTSGFNMAINTDYHLVMTNNYGENKLSLYVNGSLFNQVATATQQYNPVQTPGLNIGFGNTGIDGGGTANYITYPGRIYGGRVYKMALSAGEVKQNFNALRGRYGV